MIAFGVIADPRPPMSYSERNERMRVPPYLRDGWNILDFVVVVTSLIRCRRRPQPDIHSTKGGHCLRLRLHTSMGKHGRDACDN